MKRLSLFLFAAAALLFVLPTQSFAAITTYCSDCGPSIEAMVYFDAGNDGAYSPKEDALQEGWRVFLYNDQWELLGSALTGGGDGVFNAGIDTGKVYFRPLRVGIPYTVCAEFPRDWTGLTEPIIGDVPRLGHRGGLVEVIPNPETLSQNDPPLGERNWDEGRFCYRVALHSPCDKVKVRFGVFTY